MVNKFMKPFEFCKFAESGWHKFEKHLYEARDKAAEFFGGGQVYHMPYYLTKYTGDQKYLAQIPPKLWKSALASRLGEELMKTSNLAQSNEPFGELPEGWEHDTQPHIEFDVKKRGRGGSTREKYHPSEGESKIYTGHGHLFNTLNKKVNKEELRKLNPRSEEDIQNYLSKGHHFYDYDTSDPKWADPADIDQMTDQEILNLLTGHDRAKYKELRQVFTDELSKKGIEEDPNKPELEQMRHVMPQYADHINMLIKRILGKRERMKKPSNQPHSMAGFDVMQPAVANNAITTWMNAMRLGLLGPPLHAGQMVPDPVTGKPKPIVMVPPGQFKEAFGRELTLGHRPETKKGAETKGVAPMDERSMENLKKMGIDVNSPVPAIMRNINGENTLIPYLYDAGSIPQIPKEDLNDWQRAMLTYRNDTSGHTGLNKFKPGSPEFVEHYKQLEENCKKKKGGCLLTGRINKFQTLRGLFNNLDLLNPEQWGRIKGGFRTMPELAKAYHTNEYDEFTHPRKVYTIGGYNPNKKSSYQPGLGILDEAKKKAIYDKYWQQLLEESLTGVQSYIRNAEKNGVSPDIIKALEEYSTDIAVIGAYLLLTHLNDEEAGIYDPQLGLVNPKGRDESEEVDEPSGEEQYDEDEESDSPKVKYTTDRAKRARIAIVRNFTRNMEQAALGDKKSRRQAQRDNIFSSRYTLGELGQEEEGLNVMNSVDAWKQRVAKELAEEEGTHDPGSQRGRLFSNPEKVIRAGEKIGGGAGIGDYGKNPFANAGTYLNNVRAKLKKQLGGLGQDQIDHAEQRIVHGFSAMAEMYDQAYKNIETQNPQMHPDKINAEVLRYIDKNFDKDIEAKHPEIFKNMNSEEKEKLRSDLKNKLTGRHLIKLREFEKSERVRDLDEFVRILTKTGKASLPEYAATYDQVDPENQYTTVILKHLQDNPDAIFEVFKRFFDETKGEEEKSSLVQALNKWALPLYFKAMAYQTGSIDDQAQKRYVDDLKYVFQDEQKLSFNPVISSEFKAQYPTAVAELAKNVPQTAEPAKSPVQAPVVEPTRVAAKPQPTNIEGIINSMKATNDPNQLTALASQLTALADQIMRYDPESLGKIHDEVQALRKQLHGRVSPEAGRAIEGLYEKIQHRLFEL